MDYLAFHFLIEPDNQEVLLGMLSMLPFESFEERPGRLVAYLPASLFGRSLDVELNRVKEKVHFEFFVEYIKAQNWNEIWESNFHPIQVGNFCGIRAEFHPSFGDTVRFELCIQPRMAFGTGHHETTYMMIALMEQLPIPGARVLDFGTGTGILAILAVKLGASAVDALEIDPIACENARENCLTNKTEIVDVIEGGLDLVSERHYDIVLANINRYVLLESFAPLYEMLSPTGLLMISGILATDREIVEEALRIVGFALESLRLEGQWVAMVLRRK